jgi:hypothetical protein
MRLPRPDGLSAHSEIHERAGRSLWLVSIGQALSGAFGFASVVLARRLSPADFGLFAISTFVVVFVGMIADLGLRQAIQRREELTTHDIRAAFTCSRLPRRSRCCSCGRWQGFFPRSTPNRARAHHARAHHGGGPLPASVVQAE